MDEQGLFDLGELRRSANGIYNTPFYRRAAYKMFNMRPGRFGGTFKREGSFFIDETEFEMSSLHGWGWDKLVYTGDFSQPNSTINIYYPLTGAKISLNLGNTGSVLSPDNRPQLFAEGGTSFLLKLDEIYRITPYAYDTTKQIEKLTDIKTSFNAQPVSTIEIVGNSMRIHDTRPFVLVPRNTDANTADGFYPSTFELHIKKIYVDTNKSLNQPITFTGTVYNANTNKFYANGSVTVRPWQILNINSIRPFTIDYKELRKTHTGLYMADITYLEFLPGSKYSFEIISDDPVTITGTAIDVSFKYPDKAVYLHQRLFLFGDKYVAFSEPGDPMDFKNGANKILVPEMEKCKAVTIVDDVIVFASEHSIYSLRVEETPTFLPKIGKLITASVVEDGLISRGQSFFIVDRKGIYLFSITSLNRYLTVAAPSLTLLTAHCSHVFNREFKHATLLPTLNCTAVRCMREDKVIIDFLYNENEKIMCAARFIADFQQVSLSKSVGNGLILKDIDDKIHVTWMIPYDRDLDNDDCDASTMLRYSFYNFMDDAKVYQSGFYGYGAISIKDTNEDLITLSDIYPTIHSLPVQITNIKEGAKIYIGVDKNYRVVDLVHMNENVWTISKPNLPGNYNGVDVTVFGCEISFTKDQVEIEKNKGRTHYVTFGGQMSSGKIEDLTDYHYPLSGTYVAFGRGFDAYLTLNYMSTGVNSIKGSAYLQTYGTGQVTLSSKAAEAKAVSIPGKFHYFDGQALVRFPQVALTNSASQKYTIHFQPGLFAGVLSVQFESDKTKVQR